jgi:SET domain-containing protein
MSRDRRSKPASKRRSAGPGVDRPQVNGEGAVQTRRNRPDMIRVRRSRLHGRGAFALRRIRKGTRIIEYLGDRVSHREADRRYDHKTTEDAHTFLFIVDRGVVIDAGTNGNDARYINHSCDPNCESVIEDRRVFIEAVRTIQPGDELTYDYQIGRDRDDPPNVDEIFACRCGTGSCRGTMLWPPKRKRRTKAS